MEDYYKILAITENATQGEINESFFKTPLLHENFDNIWEAWLVLRDPKSRKEYDQKLKEARNKETVESLLPEGVSSECRLCGKPLPKWYEDLFSWGKDIHRKQCNNCGRCKLNDESDCPRCDDCKKCCWGLQYEEGWRGIFGPSRCSTCYARAVHKKEQESTEREEAEYMERERVENERRATKEAVIARYRQLRNDIEAMPQYQIWREEVLKKFGARCAICGSTEDIEVDHRYESFYSIIKRYGITSTIEAYECPALWNVSNGAPLCKQHHDQTTSSIYYKMNN